MEFFAKTEAQRLNLFHLTSLFFHEGFDDLSVRGEIEEEKAVLTITRGGISYEGKAPLDLKLHREQNRAENAALGLAFGRAAEKLTSYRPPYGTLTGVRPVKVPLFYLDAGESRETTEKILTHCFLVSPEKAKLLLDLAETEREFRSSLSPKDAMLYISIPFCPSRCSYCSFISSAAPKHLSLIPDYLTALTRQIRQTAELIGQTGRKIRSVYVGGGTPGILTAEQMDLLLGEVRRAEFGSLREFCVEMGRPDTVTEEKLRILKEYGVDRISINPQTVHDKTLERIGRKHSAFDFFNAMEMAKRFDFSAVNCDLIAALPGEGPEEFLESVRTVLALEPQNLTVHALCQKKSAGDQIHTSSLSFREAVDESHRLCINAGLNPYYLYRQKMAAADLENLGFAKDGSLGVYNLAMMEDLVDIFACGAGGIGKRIPSKNGEKILRFANHKYPYEYLSHPEKSEEILRLMKEAIQ